MPFKDIAKSMARAHARNRVSERTGLAIARAFAVDMGIKHKQDYLVAYAVEYERSRNRIRAQRAAARRSKRGVAE